MVRAISGSDLAAGLRLASTLPWSLRHPLSANQARATVVRRIHNRDRHFLRLMRSILGSRSKGLAVYRALLRWSGCEYGDIEQMVQREGLESTLRTLLDRGVYLSVEEFKGRRPVMRGSLTLETQPHDVRNPRARSMVPARTGASRSSGTPVFLDLDFVRDCAVDLLAFLDARAGIEWHKATWESPGAGAMFRILKMSSFGAPAKRWFTQVRHDEPGLHARYRWSSRVVVWESRLVGRPVPPPRYVSLGEPGPIVDWLAAVRRRGATPYLHCFASAAVVLCQAAQSAGVDISGSQLLAMGEPFTPARRAVTQAAGVRALPRYGAIEAGPIGYGCEAPLAADEVHLVSDLHAVVQPSTASAAGAPLFVTSLSPRAPFSLLNVSFGDSGVLCHRSCGCAVEATGWTTHLHTIRSLEKLTAGGSNFLDVDIIRVLEEELPRAFGGSPVDYQLVDEDRPDGRPGLCLLVSPSVGAIDEARVSEYFLQALASAGGAEHLMTRVWSEADALRVERHSPRTTQSGKVLHVFQTAPADP